MKPIKNRRAWLLWKRKEIGNQEGVEEPAEYPCFAYTSVQSFGYEEYAANYLYRADIQKMAKALTEEESTRGV